MLSNYFSYFFFLFDYWQLWTTDNRTDSCVLQNLLFLVKMPKELLGMWSRKIEREPPLWCVVLCVGSFLDLKKSYQLNHQLSSLPLVCACKKPSQECRYLKKKIIRSNQREEPTTTATTMQPSTTHYRDTLVATADASSPEEEDEKEEVGAPKLLFSVGPYGITEALPHCHHQDGHCNSALYRAIRTDQSSSALGQHLQSKSTTTTTRTTFLLKMLLGGATTRPATRATLRHEFKVLKELQDGQVDGVIRPVELISTPERGLVLVLQDLEDWHPHPHHHNHCHCCQHHHGQTLRQLITSISSFSNKAERSLRGLDNNHHHNDGKQKKKQKTKKKKERITLKQFFMIAIGIVEVLQRLHKRGYVHKDIKPDSIGVLFLPLKEDKEEGGRGEREEVVKVQLLDFDSSEKLKQHAADTHKLGKKEEEEEEKYSSEEEKETKEKKTEGTWAYMSPEQTGRTKRLVDYRTDFYSLGKITLSDLFSSVVQFNNSSESQR